MGSAFRSEVLAIQKLRAKYPEEGQTTLAKRINSRNFDDAADRQTATSVGSRTYYSVYSVIRRYDQSRRLVTA